MSSCFVDDQIQNQRAVIGEFNVIGRVPQQLVMCVNKRLCASADGRLRQTQVACVNNETKRDISFVRVTIEGTENFPLSSLTAVSYLRCSVLLLLLTQCSCQFGDI